MVARETVGGDAATPAARRICSVLQGRAPARARRLSGFGDGAPSSSATPRSMRAAEHPDIGGGVKVAGDAEVDPAVVREDRDANPHVASQRDERKRLEHPPLREVQGVLRAGDVGGDGVDAALRQPCGHPPSERQQHRGGKPAERSQPLRRDRLTRLLEILHLLVQGMHSLDGILQPDRQLREHRRDLVVIGPGRIIGADRHGHERAENASLDGLAATEQELPEATGDRGEHHIVDRAAVKRADLLDVHQPRPRPVPPSVRADRTVERAGRVAAQKRPQIRETAGDVDGLPGNAARTAHRRQHGPQPLERTGRTLRQRVSHQRGRARFGRRCPAIVDRGRRRRAPCRGSRSSGPSPRPRRPCNGAPLRSPPSGRRRAPPRPTSPRAALRDPAAGT